jgi:hypothetical protein
MQILGHTTAASTRTRLWAPLVRTLMSTANGIKALAVLEQRATLSQAPELLTLAGGMTTPLPSSAGGRG